MFSLQVYGSEIEASSHYKDKRGTGRERRGRDGKGGGNEEVERGEGEGGGEKDIWA